VQIIKEMSEFHFLPPKINFVPSFTQFNKKISKLPHLTIFLPHFTPFYILVHLVHVLELSQTIASGGLFWPVRS
jgi:hypothetical protein